jgi:hypothetical protein
MGDRCAGLYRITRRYGLYPISSTPRGTYTSRWTWIGLLIFTFRDRGGIHLVRNAPWHPFRRYIEYFIAA